MKSNLGVLQTERMVGHKVSEYELLANRFTFTFLSYIVELLTKLE